KYKLDKDSVILLEQIRTLDKKRLKEKLTFLSDSKMIEVDNALDISLGLNNFDHHKS
ncbi:MAG: type II toxin-antitoxin system PemK/MazF family toxin, partial [Staphylococcus epidermidis]|nr:type II toxin-antitoxin system PemK/MazF family toxin [Staphylococcus epidermidis]